MCGQGGDNRREALRYPYHIHIQKRKEQPRKKNVHTPRERKKKKENTLPSVGSVRLAPFLLSTVRSTQKPQKTTTVKHLRYFGSFTERGTLRPAAASVVGAVAVIFPIKRPSSTYTSQELRPTGAIVAGEKANNRV